MAITITQADLEKRFGTSNVTVWSDLENTGSADTDRIAEALAIGQAKVRDKFRLGPYTVPFEGTEADLRPVKDLMLVYAGAWLYFSRGLQDTSVNERMQDLADRADAEIREYFSGRARLGATRAETMPTAPIVIQ